MQYARNAHDAHDVLCNRVPLFRGGGGPHNLVSSLRGCSTRVHTSPMGRYGRGLRRLDPLVPPRHAHDKLHVLGVPEALDVHVLPARSTRPTRTPGAAMRAQEAARKALRCMHRRDRSGWRCVVELRAAKVPLLEDVPLEFPHRGLLVRQSQCLGGGLETVATLHMPLDFTVSKSPLVPFNSTICPRNGPKRRQKAPKTAHCAPTPRNQARAVFWATWLKI